MSAKLVTSPVHADRPLANSRMRNQRIGETIEKLAPQRSAAMGKRVVRTVFNETPLDIISGQS